eukprot:1194522-Prorocentrum_minimum.AAC.1
MGALLRGAREDPAATPDKPREHTPGTNRRTGERISEECRPLAPGGDPCHCGALTVASPDKSGCTCLRTPLQLHLIAVVSVYICSDRGVALQPARERALRAAGGAYWPPSDLRGVHGRRGGGHPPPLVGAARGPPHGHRRCVHLQRHLRGGVEHPAALQIEMFQESSKLDFQESR